MESLFERLSKEAAHYENVIMPVIQKQADDAKANNDIDGLKEAIKRQDQCNERLKDIVGMLKRISK